MREKREKTDGQYSSRVFRAQYSGYCAMSGKPFSVGTELVYFRAYPYPCIYAQCSNRILMEQVEATGGVPVVGQHPYRFCGCGELEEAGHPNHVCLRCDEVCEEWYGLMPEDVGRETFPKE